MIMEFTTTINTAFFIGLDPMYFIVVGPAILLGLIAQVKVKSAFNKWSQVQASRRLTGREVAERVLQHAGVQGVVIEESHGFLSDHYDPRERVLRLSPANYTGRSVAAAAIAAHEAGHAMQHAFGYAPLKLRSISVPLASFGSNAAMILLLIGLLFQFTSLAILGLLFFGFVVAFQLITLPVEFNASSRAKLVLADTGVITSREEQQGVNSVLNAAALTYVAGAVMALSQLLYYAMLIFGGRSRD